MLETCNEFAWERFLLEHPKLRELAIDAGVEKNPKRALELNCAHSVSGGNKIVKSEAERAFARYLYSREFENE